jgi:Subtilase family
MTVSLDETEPFRHEFCKALVWRMGALGQGCKVAVIDTGVDIPWLKPHLLSGDTAKIYAHDFTPGHEGSGDASDDHHGSRIVGAVLQSAPQAEIHSLRVYSASHGPSREKVAAALEWCARSGMRVVNLSTSFYGDGCSLAAPCVLCRAINTFGLAADLFTVTVGGDAYTLNEQAAKGELPSLCPATNSALGWAVEGPEVVWNRAEVLKVSLESDSGFSFTTAKFSGGAALLRGIEPPIDMFTLRKSIRNTCLPLHEPDKEYLGLGRHCFFLAFLHTEGLRAGIQRLVQRPNPESLRTWSKHRKGDADGGVCFMLEWITVRLMVPQQYAEALAVADVVSRAIEPWAGPLEKALVQHLRACCLEGLGQSYTASVAYAESTAMLERYLGLSDAADGAAASKPAQ